MVGNMMATMVGYIIANMVGTMVGNMVGNMVGHMVGHMGITICSRGSSRADSRACLIRVLLPEPQGPTRPMVLNFDVISTRCALCWGGNEIISNWDNGLSRYLA